MTTPTRLLLALSISLTLNAAAADKPVWYGEANCRIAALEPHPAGDFVKWRGKCKDGYADGAGVLEWGVWGHGDRTLEANLARGEVVGEGTLVDEKGTYIGTFRNGVPHGQGYFKYADGDGLYEGGVANGLREGAGIFIARDRSRYEGGWKADKRHGHGRETFARGGSYEGGWKDDQFDGHGKIVYAGSGRTFEGQFENGRVAGTPAPEVDTTPKFSMRETEPASSRSRTPEFALRSNVPFDAKWTELTVAQQNSFKKGYPALESGDEPPYPTDGWGVLLKVVLKARDQFQPVRGFLGLYVLVGKDGKAKSITSFGSPNPELTRYVSLAAAAQQYKPAICHGEPCEMIYPVIFSFE